MTMTNDRSTAPYAAPTHFVLVMSGSQHKMQRLLGALDNPAISFECIDRPTALTARAGYQHYDAIIVDLDGARQDIMSSVGEIRRLEDSRAQPPTPIVGISSDDDALADLDAVQRGCTEVFRGQPEANGFSRIMGKHLRGALLAA